MASGGAAFFDLDRTLLRGASGPIITETLIAAGIVRDRKVPGMGLFYKFYDVVGETLPGMFLARRAADFASGWVREAVMEAAETAADVLVDSVAPFAAPLMDEHRRAGRPVVLATTTPYDLVKPLAERLHFDDVIATTYAEEEGKYTGKLDGGFVWGTGKLAAVRRWAEDRGVDLNESWAYSDSIFDFPLLSAVGHPHAVNPDPRLRFAALLRRWPVRHLDLPAGVPKLVGMEPARLLRPFLRPELFPYARFDISGIERIPVDGPAIIVANHRSYFDTAAVALTVARSGRPVRFLGKAEVFDAPVVGQLARAMGGIRVDRGSGSGEPLQAAAEALQAGELVALMPQGTIPRGREFFEPVLRGRHGAARLAAMSRAPVIPIGMWGTEKVWPRNARVPNMLNLTSPPSIRTRVGPPVALSYEDVHADTASIMAAIVDLLPDEARQHHEPTEEELARTMPAGKKAEE